MHNANATAKNAKPEELEGTLDVKIGYDKSVWLVGLVSQEIYSRFNSLLTIHGLFLAAYGLLFTRVESGALARVLLLVLPIAGWCLCILWRRFVRHGIAAQCSVRRKAAEFEGRSGGVVSIFTELTHGGLVEEARPNGHPHFSI
jgi:hypothetical protein